LQLLKPLPLLRILPTLSKIPINLTLHFKNLRFKILYFRIKLIYKLEKGEILFFPLHYSLHKQIQIIDPGGMLDSREEVFPVYDPRYLLLSNCLILIRIILLLQFIERSTNLSPINTTGDRLGQGFHLLVFNVILVHIALYLVLHFIVLFYKILHCLDLLFKLRLLLLTLRDQNCKLFLNFIPFFIGRVCHFNYFGHAFSFTLKMLF